MIRILLIITFLSLFTFSGLFAQQSAYPVYLFGNTANLPISETNYRLLQEELARQTGPFTVVHLGDIVAREGWPENPTAEKIARLQQLLNLVKDKPNGKIMFVPGDREWANSGNDGLTAVRRLGKYIADRMPYKNAIVPGNGCPGPEVLDITSNLRIIAINSQWWMHPYQKPELPDTDCRTITKEEFLEELDEAIAESENHNVLLVGHHPVISTGYYSGRIPLKKHIFPLTEENPKFYLPLPILGSIYAAYRQNIGTPRDMANHRYADFREKMTRTFRLNPGTIYASAHDYSLQLNYTDETYHLVSGSIAEKQGVGSDQNTKFRASVLGFAKLEYFPDGQVVNSFYQFAGNELKLLDRQTLYASPCAGNSGQKIPVNQYFRPCPVAQTIPENPDPSIRSGVTSIVAGPQYAASPTKQFFFGKLYRSTWTTPVQAPYLDLRHTYGGLKPVGPGGGRQTKSLKFASADGSQYVFRSIDKDPIKALPLAYRETFITQILRDIMATGNPYGALIVSSLLDSTDILHARPKLYVLPNDPLLGAYRSDYAGLFGMLEERPVNPKKNEKSFAGATEIPRTINLYRKLYDDHDNRLDAYAFGKARAFDIWIGDFGRHDDNWRWAGFKQNGKTIFKPIPRDRDHAFSQWNGFFPWLADRKFVVKSIQDFGYEYEGLPSLTYPARYLDRSLLAQLNRQDWQRIATELQASMDEATITKAVAAAPAEIASASGNEIGAKLKTRIKKLPQALDEYYLQLAKFVDVLGTNQDEYFRVERLPDGRVRVQEFVKDPKTGGAGSELLFDRTFVPAETREIRIFALNGNDVVDISGESRKSILVRVIGGDGQDKITDKSHVSGLKHFSKIYDTPDTQLERGPETKDLTSNRTNVNEYNRQDYKENYVGGYPGLIYNRSDGLGASFTLNFVRYIFREPEPKRTYTFYIGATGRGAFLVSGGALWNNVFGRWGLGGTLTRGSYFPFYNFFGLGNNTTKNDALFDERFYYLARYKGYRAEAFTQARFLRKSFFRFGPVYENLNSTTASGTILDENNARQFVLGNEELLGGQAELDFDLRDKEVFTRRGLRFQVKHTTSQRLNGRKNTFGLTQGSAQYFGTARLFIPITLALKLGGAKNYGKELPFYKYTTLGLSENLRGFVNNRFSGDKSAYLNSELRFHLGRSKNHFLPFYFGLIGFYDQGKVWYQGVDAGGWHRGYGGGFYVAPIEERYALTLLLGHSREENILLQFSLGLVLDK